MEHHRMWLWRRKSSEKATQGNDKAGLLLKGNQEAEELKKSLKTLGEKLASAIDESNAKDDLLAKHTRVAEEALEGWEKAEAEAASFKQELDEAEERISEMGAAMEDCRRRLESLRKEQERASGEAELEISMERERNRKLEQRLVEVNGHLSKMVSENGNLVETLAGKEKEIDELSRLSSWAEAKNSSLADKLGSLEKQNASLKYEVCMLEKEIQIRSEEKEFSLRSADAARRKHLESVKMIAELEAECKRLRVMVRKRLPGPAAMSKMRTEASLSNKKSTPPVGPSAAEVAAPLVDKVNALEEENRMLSEALTKKTRELQSAWIMCARTASKLSRAETQLEELPKGRRPGGGSADVSPISGVGGGDGDGLSCAESWASALMSELENFRQGKPAAPSPRASAASEELCLMDDFLETEKLAVVCVDKPLVSSKAASEGDPVSLASLSSFDSSLSSSAKAEAAAGQSKPKPEAAVRRLAELVEGIKEGGGGEGETCYVSRVFQWKASELSPVLRRFLETCKGFLEQKADLEAFFEALGSTMEWVVDHCFSIQDVAATKGSFKDLDWSASHSEGELQGSPVLSEQPPRDDASEVKLKAAIRKEEPAVEEEQKLPGTGWEISLASEKLAECQETIMNLGKQLKALAAPRDAVLFDQVIAPTAGGGGRENQRVALLDWILADSNRSLGPDTTGANGRFAGDGDGDKPVVVDGKNPNAGLLYGRKVLRDGGGVQTLPTGSFYGMKEPSKAKTGSETGAIVVAPKRSRSGVSLLRRLLHRRKKESNARKLALSAVAH
ncbi:unnamed protein product [Spirodela intermedia]|uniref:Uncharacterized protein n=1 Tax=Spirodela intermedia TaxID=51605 RepID=A0A7I8LAE3_SPIIN|nr:unnamed protein product [Spirodela intermedia]